MLVMVTGTEECVLKWIQGPRLGITEVSVIASEDSCTVSFDYLISACVPPYTVAANLGFDPSAGNTPSEAFRNSGVISADLLHHASEGLYFETHWFPVMPVGSHFVALEVKDFHGDSDVMWYPWKVWFFPE